MALDIRQSKEDLTDLIRRRLGEPVVKVELNTQQIFDAIDYAKPVSYTHLTLPTNREV